MYKCNISPACNLCRECVDACSVEALTFKDNRLQYDGVKCTYCEVCMDVCPEFAIRISE